MTDHDALIQSLANRLSPVRRIRAGWVRAVFYVPLALALGYGATAFLHRGAVDWASPAAWVTAGNIVLSACLGVAAFVGALNCSLADGMFRTRPWMIVALLAWLGLAVVSISVSRNPMGAIGQGRYCFQFMMCAGLPMLAVVIVALRQTRSIRPLASLALAGVGVSFLCFGLLAFCHPIAMSIVDFIGHLAAAILLSGLIMGLGRRFVAL